MEPATNNKPLDLYDLSFEAMSSLMSGWGYGRYHAKEIWRYLYVEHVLSIAQMTELNPESTVRLEKETMVSSLHEIGAQYSSDGLTRKYLLSLADGEKIESVVMYHQGRITACISTQVGCAMGCVFCATGQMGFVRHLTCGEIVAQVLHILRPLDRIGASLRNVVYMGMGEPLHNFQPTMDSIDTLTSDRGLAIGPRYLTISTVGLPKAIIRLAHDERPFNLAVSLHAATDHERTKLVPVGERWPLAELMDACRLYTELRRRRIFFEWALIAGRNDSSEQAHALGRLLNGIDSHVNLILLNPTEGFHGDPSDPEARQRFQRILGEYGVPSTIRQRRGVDIQAGCGQLRAWAEGEITSEALI